MIFHQPVMLHEVLESLQCKSDGIYIDATVGGAGHARAILEKSQPRGLLIGVDCDEEALQAAAERLATFGNRKILVRDNFSELSGIAARLGLGRVDGVLFDLGVSSHQLDEPARGFSFSQEAPLDMRMDCREGFTAYELVNNYQEMELAKVIRDYGEEKMARRIARAIVKQREKAPITTTTELAALVLRIVAPGSTKGIHPATRTFQAIRIAVNNELGRLPQAIKGAIDLLTPGGRLVVISFHSLEDRIVKNEFRRWAGACTCPPKLPVCICGQTALVKIVTKKPLRPGSAELTANPRARSARLRTVERI